jgi:hypothetical protein
VSSKHPVYYANASDRVGNVRVYKCPLCCDGERVKELEARLAAAEAVCRVAGSISTGGLDDIKPAIKAWQATRTK